MRDPLLGNSNSPDEAELITRSQQDEHVAQEQQPLDSIPISTTPMFSSNDNTAITPPEQETFREQGVQPQAQAYRTTTSTGVQATPQHYNQHTPSPTTTTTFSSRRRHPLTVNTSHGNNRTSYTSNETLTSPRISSYSSNNYYHGSSNYHNHQQQQQQQHHHHANNSSSHQQYSSNHSSNKWAPEIYQHRVYILNCANCNAFLSDRGMRAVLLLKPHITLYSTDAAPTSSGPVWSEACDLSGSDFSEATSMTEDSNVERTCSCLTQSLGCFGCGNIIGYHIVSPCTLCSQSVAKHERSANGHRYVFHQAEVTSRERRYIPGEPGIKAQCVGNNVVYYSHNYGSNGQQNYQHQRHLSSSSSSSSGSEPSLHTSPSSGDLRSQYMAQESSADKGPSPTDAYGTNSYGYRSTYQQRSHNRPRLLEGDVIFWSMLVDGGERPQPINPDLYAKPVLPMVPGR